MNKEYINQIILGDAEKILPEIKSNTIDVVLTDPPYFLDKMDNNWNHEAVSTITDHCNTIKSLPPGMKFDKEQGKRFYQWYLKISQELYRVLKPGGFLFSFSSPRLYHRMASAVDAVILDPFVGSGTTVVASKKLGRNFIGIDINEE